MSENDYNTSKSALFSKYSSQTKISTPREEKKVEKVEEKKPEEKKVETKKEDVKKVEGKKQEDKKHEEKKVEEVKKDVKKPEEKKVEEKKPEEKKPEEKKPEEKKDSVTHVVKETPKQVDEFWTKEKMESTKPMGLEVGAEDDMPELENQDTLPNLENQDMPNLEGTEGAEGESSQSRAEKKARKAFSKLGLKAFPGVRKVTIKQAQLLFFIPKPEVYKLGNSYVIFGKVSYKDNTGKKGFEDLKNNNFGKEKESTEDDIPTLEEQKEEINMDSNQNVEVQIEEKDIELIQKSCPSATREDMIKAYKDNGGDVVNAIMELKSKGNK